MVDEGGDRRTDSGGEQTGETDTENIRKTRKTYEQKKKNMNLGRLKKNVLAR